MTEKTLGLLTELTRLLRRYDVKDFEQLASLIGTPAYIEALQKLLAELATSHRKVSESKSATRKTDVLEAIRQQDEPRYLVLRSIKEKILDTRLHKLTDVVRIVEENGIPLRKRSFRRRDELVREVLQVSSSLTTEKLGQIASQLASPKTASDLRSWSDLILPKKDAS